jgi:U3 small nucleolar RNA-associated protein 15
VELLAGSLDHHLKAYSLTDYKVVHSHKYSAPLLSVDVSPNGSTLAVGMSNGLLSLEPNKKAAGAVKTQNAWLTNPSSAAPRRGSRAYFMRGSSYDGKDEDLFLNSSRRRKLASYDKYLKSFQYGAALDAALNRVRFYCGVRL